MIENQLAKIGRAWSHFLFCRVFQPQSPKARRGRKKCTKQGRKIHVGAPTGPTARQKYIVIPSSSSGPKVPKVYQRRISRLKELELASYENLPSTISSPQVVSLPFESSLANKNLLENIIGKEIEVKSQVEETPLFETFKGGKLPHTGPKNKLRFKIKLRSNLELAKEVIDIENMPLKYLIINTKNIAGSKNKKYKETKGKGPMETRQRKT